MFGLILNKPPYLLPMPKDERKARLNQIKLEKNNAVKVDEMKFRAIADQIMKRKNLGNSTLQDYSIEDINRAAEFWKAVLKVAEEFIQNR